MSSETKTFYIEIHHTMQLDRTISLGEVMRSINDLSGYNTKNGFVDTFSIVTEGVVFRCDVFEVTIPGVAPASDVYMLHLYGDQDEQNRGILWGLAEHRAGQLGMEEDIDMADGPLGPYVCLSGPYLDYYQDRFLSYTNSNVIH